MKQAHLYISGFVQGVGFRQYVRDSAKKMGLTGWVKNTPEGTVEALIQGKVVDLKELIQVCKNGPFLAEVKDIKVTNAAVKEHYFSFEIV